jgi:uncharacterized protein (DUF1810 family)
VRTIGQKSRAVDDPYDLERYVRAQEAVYARVCAELTAGRKASHWMWFIFPQLRGLGSSPTAQHYALNSLAEARAYLGHPLLGERLRECTRLVNRIEGRSARAIFGYPDDLKFRSCMTLFAQAAAGPDAAAPDSGASAGRPDAVGGASLFGEALARYYGGEPDPLTRKLLDADSSPLRAS